MTHKPAAQHDTPVPESGTHKSQERDTLNDTPELRFLRDEIEALLGAPSVRRAMHTPSISYSDPRDAILAQVPRPMRDEDEVELEDTAKFGSPTFDADTEPSIDAKLVREAVRGAGK